MSIEYYAALNKDRVPDVVTMNAVAQTMGIPMEVGPGFADLSRYGFRGARFSGRDSGVEIGLAPIESVGGTYEAFDKGTKGRCDSVVTLAFGSDGRQGAVAMGVGAVLCRTADALAYSTEDGRFVLEAELIGWMLELETFAQQSEKRR